MSDRLRALFSGPRGTVLSVAIVVWALAILDLTLIHREVEPLLPALHPSDLLGVRVSPETTVVTSADPTIPVGPWLLTRRGDAVEVVGTELPPTRREQRLAHWEFRPRLVARARGVGQAVPVDVDAWRGRQPALFTVSSPREHPVLTIYLLGKSEHPVLRANLPLPRQSSDRRSFFVATWSGPLPDLFVVDYDAQRREPLRAPSLRPWSISVYSGESGFKRRIDHSLLRRKLSRRLSKYEWWLDLAARRKSRPNLILVTRARRTGSHHLEIHVLAGKKNFHGFALHAATELPQRVGPTRRFVFQPRPRGGSVLMLEASRGQFSLRPIPLP